MPPAAVVALPVYCTRGRTSPPLDPGVVYQFKITLKYVKPPVWRRVQVKDGTLAKLHDVIQTVMPWTNSHLRAFEVGGEQYGEPDPTGMMDTMEQREEARIKLIQVVSQGHKKFSYTCDFGDKWEHVVLFEKAPDAEAGSSGHRDVARHL